MFIVLAPGLLPLEQTRTAALVLRLKDCAKKTGLLPCACKNKIIIVKIKVLVIEKVLIEKMRGKQNEKILIIIIK